MQVLIYCKAIPAIISLDIRTEICFAIYVSIFLNSYLSLHENKAFSPFYHKNIFDRK